MLQYARGKKEGENLESDQTTPAADWPFNHIINPAFAKLRDVNVR